MTVQFPDIGTFGLIDGVWLKVSSSPIPGEESVQVILEERHDFEEFRPSGEVSRSWESDYGFVFVQVERFDKVVKVGRVGRYRGEPVYRLGNVVDGRMAVGLLSNDRGTAARLGFGGDERMMGFDKMISPDEFTDVVEEITVTYRRGEGGGVSG